MTRDLLPIDERTRQSVALWRAGLSTTRATRIVLVFLCALAAGCGASRSHLSPRAAQKVVRHRMARFTAELSAWRDFVIPDTGTSACRIEVSEHALVRGFREYDYPLSGRPSVQVDVGILAFGTVDGARDFARSAYAATARACVEASQRRHYERELHRSVTATTSVGLPSWLGAAARGTIHATLLRLRIPGQTLNSQRFIFADRAHPQVDYDLVIVKKGPLPRALVRRLLAIGGR